MRTLTTIERRLLDIIPDNRWVDASSIEREMQGSGYTVEDVVNALGSLVHGTPPLLDHGTHKGPTHNIAYFRRIT